MGVPPVTYSFGLPHSAEADQKLITNFEAAAPASYFAELYVRDELYGGHVIMLGPDPESRHGLPLPDHSLPDFSFPAC